MRPKGSAERRWRGIVLDQGASGMSVAVFCRERGLATSSLFAWKRRLAVSGALVPDVGSGFVEAKVVELAPPGARRQEAEASIELELRGDGWHVLVLRPGFDARLLREVLGALAGETGGGGGVS